MAASDANIRKELLQKLIAYAHEQLPPEKAALLSTFIPKYYGNTPLDELTSRPLSDLYGAILSHWELMEERQPGECKIHVYNPHFEQNGWQSTHTVIELSYDDMPFLVDSMRMEINRLGFTSHLAIHLGGLKVKRDAAGRITALLPSDSTDKSVCTEAVIHMEIDRQTDPAILENLKTSLQNVIHDVTLVVQDWQKMREQVFKTLDELESADIPIDREEIEESKAFLRWLVSDHFTFIGFRAYEVVGEGDEAALKLVPKTGLGVLRDESSSKTLRYFSELPPKARDLVLSKHILILSKTNTRSTVHRPAYTDYIGVKRFDRAGNIIGELRFIGLYTSDAYNSNPKHIPFLRLKVETVIQKSGLPRGGHGAKALRNILETLPRDDLFQANTEELYAVALGILHMQERRRIRLFIRKDAYGRYFSCLVYIPRDNFNTELINRMQEILKKALNGTEVSFTTHFSESILARIHYVVRIDPKNPPKYDVQEIEKKLAEVGRSWKDDLRDSLLEHFGEEKGNELINRYKNAFPASYQEAFSPRAAIFDIEHMDKLSADNPLEMSFYRPLGAEDSVIRFKLFRANQAIPLSDALPMLENMGLRVLGEQPHHINLPNEQIIWINDFNMEYAGTKALNVEENKEIFQNAFNKIWRNEVENDGFNKLVLSAQLSWHEIVVLRAYAKYLRQIGFTFSQHYIESTLSSYPQIAGLLVKLFKLRFNPVKPVDETAINELDEEIKKSLDAVANLDQDRILRRYWEVINATLRTNYFQTDANGHPKSYLSFKFNPQKIPEMPLPLPMFEIFVYSPRFEAVHLRAGKVARGGLRWSDRREDFRTEILGLMKAQQVKNAVIVPSGAKGGFVPKMLPFHAGREAIMEEAIACYKNFIRGLLDITDNLISGKVIRPTATVCYDAEDPYLVVAADKGTATFSDIANSISKEYDFWLGDAFASGGSTGYDHKKIAITSRGAWESVKYHFQELNVNIRQQTITVVGIGDMSGDVFGNGMLLSENLQLIAAFNHEHIFLDPNPDPKVSYQERKRLFNLPRSSWEDYDAKLISKGGGIYRRSLKSIQLSPEIKERLQFDQDSVTPNELIRAALKAPVDLIWNGGIGTFVKATFERNNEVGDRTNDGIRVNGNELRCRVVGEGGNLGFTQLARIEYALNEGKINTDFIDNSGGVDCSDHEVNIKILLNDVILNGDMTLKQRNQLLAEMTEEVARLVIYNNYRQVRVITLAGMQSLEYLGLYGRFLEEQEHRGKINRQLEFLPDSKTLQERKANGIGLTRPELAVLLAYSKIILKEEILHSDLPDNPYLDNFIASAFPKMISEKFPKQMRQHRLHREILATQLSNALVTDMGIIFIYQMRDETGMPTPAIVNAYVIARQIFNMPSLWSRIDALDYKVDPEIQLEMTLEVIRLIRRSIRWFLRNRRPPVDIEQTVAQFSAHVVHLYECLPELLVGTEKENFHAKMQELIAANVPAETAKIMASLRYMFSALNIIEAATQYKENIDEVANIYFTLADRLELVWFREIINAYPVESHWSVLARATYKDDFDHQQRALTISVLRHRTKSKSVTGRIDSWFEEHMPLIQRWNDAVAELRSSNIVDAAMLTVAIRELLDLAEISIHNHDSAKQTA